MQIISNIYYLRVINQRVLSMPVLFFEGHNSKAELVELLKSQIAPDWDVDIVFRSMQEGSEDYFIYEPFFYNDKKHYSNGETITIKAKLERFADDTYSIHTMQLSRLKEIFAQVQIKAVVAPKDVFKFDEFVLIKDANGECKRLGTPPNDEWGDTCGRHPERLATSRYCVERDSFGAEYDNHCYVCEEKSLAYRGLVEVCPQLWDTCKCGNKQPQLRSYQDPDEGSAGRYYERCDSCYDRFWQRWNAENCRDDDDDYYE